MKTKKAFTLIELVVVMAIIAILSLIIVAAITAARRQAIVTQNRGNAKNFETAQEAYAAKNAGRYAVFGSGTSLTAALQDAQLTPYAVGWTEGTCDGSTTLPGGGAVTASNTSGYIVDVADYDCSTVLETIDRSGT